MKLADLNARARREEIGRALAWELADLAAPCSTSDLCDALAKRLEAPTADDKRLIAQHLMMAAPVCPQAVRGAESFKRFGRTMTPWRWVPVSMGPNPFHRVNPLGCPLPRDDYAAAAGTEMHSRFAMFERLADNREALRLAVLNPSWNEARCLAEAAVPAEDPFTIQPEEN